jgi:triacylglycerol lipase
VRHVVLVHGFLNTAASFRKMARSLDLLGFRVHTPSLKPNTGRKGIEELAMALKEYINNHIAADTKISLVGFSMGGLIVRFYVQRLDGLSRADHLVFISTPHYGSILAYAIPNNGCKQMRPNSTFLKDLNQDLHTLRLIQIASLWTSFDMMILPARNSRIPIGIEHKIPVLIHRWMICDRRSIEIISGFLCGKINDSAA